MVDPNRKINRLTEKDIEFLEECEREFASRFTEDDADFMEYCLKPLDDPPIIENWNSSGGDFRNESSGYRHHNHRDSNRNQRNWRNNFKQRNEYKRPPFYQKESRSRPPMNIRRDYSNFVPASRDD